MEELLKIIAGGQSWSVEDLSVYMHTTPGDIKRKLEYLEHIGIILRVKNYESNCKKCPAHCDLGLGRKNMPVFYELVKK